MIGKKNWNKKIFFFLKKHYNWLKKNVDECDGYIIIHIKSSIIQTSVVGVDTIVSICCSRI